jgi:hypothetical protein
MTRILDVAIILLMALAGYVMWQQGATIQQQRALINLMSQQPNCMGSPTVKVNTLIPRLQ